MEKKRVVVYFAHPISHYDTELENDCEEFIHNAFGQYSEDSKLDIDIVNPNTLFVQKHVDRLRAEGVEDYFDFFREMVKSCDIIVMTSFLDGKIGAGVAEEGTVAANYLKKVFLLYFDEDGIKMFKRVDPINFDELILSREETRKRIKAGVK
jgi:hypothetical protein